MPAYRTGRPNGGGAWSRTAARILDRDEHRCQIAGPECTGLATEVDHIVPTSKGGGWNHSNLRAVCTSCHHAKSAAEAADARRAVAAKLHRPARRHPGAA